MISSTAEHEVLATAADSGDALLASGGVAPPESADAALAARMVVIYQRLEDIDAFGALRS